MSYLYLPIKASWMDYNPFEMTKQLNIPFEQSELHTGKVSILTCDSSSGAEEFSIQEIIGMVMESPGKLTAAEYTEMIMAEKHLFIKPKDFTPLENTFCFFQGATHTIVAESKEGKTTFVVAELSKSEKKIIILDGDSNSISAMEKAGDNTVWLQPIEPDRMIDYYLVLVEKGVDFSDYVFVIDSLQNFTDDRDLDTNNGMKGIILRLKKLTNTGATLVILHHVTATGDKGKPFKVKGNAGTLSSSSDITYGFRRSDGLTAIWSRIDGISNGQQLGYGENQHQDQAAIQTMDALMEDN